MWPRSQTKDGGCDAQKQQLVRIAASSVFKALNHWQNPRTQAWHDKLSCTTVGSQRPTHRERVKMCLVTMGTQLQTTDMDWHMLFIYMFACKQPSSSDKSGCNAQGYPARMQTWKSVELLDPKVVQSRNMYL